MAADAAAYRANLVAFIAGVRHDLVLKATTPFVIGQTDLADYIAYKQAHGLCTTPTCTKEKLWNSEVMAAQKAVASADVFVRLHREACALTRTSCTSPTHRSSRSAPRSASSAART